jgi:hypothetical protein
VKEELNSTSWRFASPGEYQRFVNYIEALAVSGDANEIPGDPA